MSNKLENIILTIDTHEEANKQDKTRTKAIEEWGNKYGAIIEHRELELCDYSLVGEFREKEINLGLEYKAWDNFLSDQIDDMEDKLTRSSGLYSDVAFFVETSNYTFKPDPITCHCNLEYTGAAKTAMLRNGNKEPKSHTLAGMEGLFDTLQANGVHVRQLRGEAQFPYSLHNLLIYLTNPHKLKVKQVNTETAIQGFYMCLPEIGYVRAKELLANYPNPFWLCSASLESIQEVIGKRIGKNAYELLHCHDFETDGWKKCYHKDGTKADISSINSIVSSHPPGEIVPFVIPSAPGNDIHSKSQGIIPSTLDTSGHETPGVHGHPGLCSTFKPGDKKQQGSFGYSSPAVPPISNIDKEIGLEKGIDTEFEYRVICRFCHCDIPKEQDDDSGFCQDSECMTNRNKKSTDLIDKLKIYLKKPHTIPELVKEFGCTSGYTLSQVMAGVTIGYYKKTTDPNKNITVFQRIDCI